MTTKAGQLITDGGVTWIVDDVRDGARVGDIILRPTLRDGYIKANGATVKASEYPRLLAWAQESNMTVTVEQYTQDCSKYVYDRAADTLTLPNAVGRVLQGGETVNSIEAGLPNIAGVIEGISLAYRGPVKVDTPYQDGMFYFEKMVNIDYGYIDYGGARIAKATADASKSNPIYGRSDTVQPSALSLIAQIKY